MLNPDVAKITKSLGIPFPKSAIKRRAGGRGQMFEYVEGNTVIHRLIEATGNQWSFHVTRLEKHDDLLMAVGELTIPGLGTRTGIGVQLVRPNSGEDLWKGAATDALKKAATLFGVALELYGPDYEGELAAAAPTEAPTEAPSKPVTPPPVAPSRNGSNVIDEAFGPPMPAPAKRAESAGVQRAGPVPADAPDAPRVTTDQVTELADLIRDSDTSLSAFLNYFRVGQLEDLTNPDYWRAKKLLGDKLDHVRAKALEKAPPAGALGGAK